MFTKVQFTVQINVQVFLKLHLLNRVIVKVQWRVWYLFVLGEKITYFACLLGSELKVIYHWFAQAFILLKSLFKLVADKFILSTTEKSEGFIQYINSLRFYSVCFYCIPSWGLLKHIETKLQTTFFYLISKILYRVYWWTLYEIFAHIKLKK